MCEKKKIAAIAIAIVALVACNAPALDLTDWAAQAAATPDNVITDATGWTFDGTAGVPFDYGTLGTGTVAGEATVEYIFDLSDSGVSVAVGSVLGWAGAEKNTYKIEQWNDQGIFGVTLEGYYDETYPGIASTFDVLTHAVFVTRDGHQELYLNGAYQGIDTRTGGWWTTGGQGMVGSHSNGTADVPIGTIYGVASYNRALTGQEISDLSGAVPEPATMALLGLGGLGLIRRRK